MKKTFATFIFNRRRIRFRHVVSALILILSFFQETCGLSFSTEPTGTGYYKRRDVVRLACQVDSVSADVVWYLNGNLLQHYSAGSGTSSNAGQNKFLRTSARSSSHHQHNRAFIRRDASVGGGGSTPNRTVHPDYIVERIANGSALVFAPFRPQANAGEYHCAATESDSGVTIISKSVILKKPVGPKQEFEEYMRSVEALSGNNVVLNCTQPVHSEPAVYKWRYRKSQILANFEDIEQAELPVGKFVTTPNGNLYLYNVSAQFAGDYRCVTYNELLDKDAVTSYYYRLFVRNPKSLRNPVISHFPWFSSTTVETGQSFTLECNADGAPRPTVAWRFSSSSASTSFGGGNKPSQYKHKLHTQFEGILTINNASLDDSGIYACELEPAGSEFIKTVNVTVVPPLAVDIFVVVDGNNENAQSLNLTVGASSNLRCAANRPLAPYGSTRVSWFRNGVALGTDAIGVHQEVHTSDANLVITNAQLGDSGVYQCFLAEEQSAGRGSNNGNLFRSPFIASVASVDYYHSAGSQQPQQQQQQQFNSAAASSSSSSSGSNTPLVFIGHADVFISVTWPVTTLAPTATSAAAAATTASIPAEDLSTARPEEAEIIDAPVVSRIEKQPAHPSNIELHWDFKVPSTHKDAVVGFSVEYCNVGTPKLWDPSVACSKWQVGAIVNATHRSAIINVVPQYGAATLTVPDATAFVFRVAAQFKAPFFGASSNLLMGNTTLQPVVVEPIMPPSELKAMAIGSDRIAAVWTDSAQLEALGTMEREKLWYEIQWRPLGSSSVESSNVYEVQHFTIRKPVMSIKAARHKTLPYVVLAELTSSTFYEVRVRYIRIHDTVGQVDPISTWSGVVHAETAMADTPPLLDTHNLPSESLGTAVSALFYPRLFDSSSTPANERSTDGLFGASSELLYTVLGIVMGCLVITLIVFVVLCALRQKKQRKHIQNMRRQLNRLPSKENLNRLLTQSQLQQSGNKMRPQFVVASPQGTSLSHHTNDDTANSQFSVSQQFQQQIGLFTGSALSSPTAVSAAVAATGNLDLTESILIADARFQNNGDRPKLSTMRQANAYGTMSRLSSGSKHMNGGTVSGTLQSPHVAHNPFYRTLDNRRMFANGNSNGNGVVPQNNNHKFAMNGKIMNGGGQMHVEQQQPLLSAESAFVDPPYELPSAVIAASQQQQRLILANQHALAGLGGPPMSSAATASPANSVAQHYSTYSTFGRKNPLNTAGNRMALSNGGTYLNNGECPDGVALAEMGVTTNGLFISNGHADMSGRSVAGVATSIKSSSTSPSATVAMHLGSLTFNQNGQIATSTPPNGHQRNGSLVGAAHSTVSGSIALSDHNGDDGHSNFTVEVPAPLSNGLAQRYASSGATTRNTANGSSVMGAAYRPQLSFLT